MFGMTTTKATSLPVKKRKPRPCLDQPTADHYHPQSGIHGAISSSAHGTTSHGLVRLIEAMEEKLKYETGSNHQGEQNTSQLLENDVQASSVIDNKTLTFVSRMKKRSYSHERLSSSHFDELWWQRYNELVGFKEDHGHCNVPQRYLPNKALGKWVHKQRQEFKKIRSKEPSTLNIRRFEALRKIGFQCTTSNRAEALWHKRFNELVEYQKENGHCNVPQKYPPNVALGKWVHRQRHEFKKIRDGEPTFLTQNRIEALGNIGFQCTTFRIWHEQAKRFQEQKSIIECTPNTIICSSAVNQSRSY